MDHPSLSRNRRSPPTPTLPDATGEAAFPLMLRQWRLRRGLSQLELALRAETTSRHLSFLETGRSRPGAEMVLRLARCLDLPLRQRNELLRAAGHRPAFQERPITAEGMEPFRAVLDQILERHEPFPAYILDARWRLQGTNRGGRWLWDMVGEDARSGNSMLAFLRHPVVWDGLQNRAEVAWAMAELLERDALATGDASLWADLDALRAWLAATPPPPIPDRAPTVLCPRILLGGQVLQTLTTVLRFGNANELTLDELRVELVFPADAATEAVLRQLGSA
jgi:transcriptional regulator with XRE-family HTH domain